MGSLRSSKCSTSAVYSRRAFAGRGSRNRFERKLIKLCPDAIEAFLKSMSHTERRIFDAEVNRLKEIDDVRRGEKELPQGLADR